jgi:hypothetical protein
MEWRKVSDLGGIQNRLHASCQTDTYYYSNPQFRLEIAVKTAPTFTKSLVSLVFATTVFRIACSVKMLWIRNIKMMAKIL